MAIPATPTEFAVSVAWNTHGAGTMLRTVDGQRVDIVHRGVWTHGFGPDFSDAMVAFNESDLRHGSIEIHLSTRGWIDHGHHLDPRYRDVLLHLVLEHDGTETRTVDGRIVPVAILPAERFRGELAPYPPEVWTRFGGEACAPQLGTSHVDDLRTILHHLGDERLSGNVARMEARLTADPPSEVLWQSLLDGLGYRANREPMAALAAALPMSVMDGILGFTEPEMQIRTARALTLGVGGFLPLAPRDGHAAGLTPSETTMIEERWAALGEPWRGSELRPTQWTRARVRPANHPALRVTMAAVIAVNGFRRGGIVAAVTDALRSGTSPVVALQELAQTNDATGLGADRALEIAATAVVPFALALADQTGDDALHIAAAAGWETLATPAANDVTKRALFQAAGVRTLSHLGARGAQGLLHLDARYCAPRRCFECPIAGRALETLD